MYICKNEDHGKEIQELEEYKDLSNGKLLICNKCHKLYYANADMQIMAELREESFLISNIDSPMNNSTIDDNGHTIYKASDEINGHAWYYCLECNAMYFKSIPSMT